MQSMEEIYNSYAKTVYRYLLSLTHDADISEEITQETFCQAIKGIDKFDGSCRITTWLCSIAKNQLYAYRRKHPLNEPIDTQADEKSIDSAEADVFSSSERIELMKRLHLLKEPFREIFYLRTFGNLSFREIGEVFDKSENWARVTYYRGKEKLREELEKNEV